MNSTVVFVLAFMLLVLPCQGQKKYEREYRIKPGAVPQKAARYIDDVFKKASIHWYGEESLTGTTIEAKLKAGGKRYSIEFDPSGTIQDVEIERSYNQIPAQTRKALSEGLNQKFDTFTVVKTQLQWTASQSDLKTAILTDNPPTSVQIRYELILKAQKGRSANYYEVLCEQDGRIVSLHQLVQRNMNNLIY